MVKAIAYAKVKTDKVVDARILTKNIAKNGYDTRMLYT